jgi:pimeloyl-ACP methyl ester carboxylesterase
VLGLAAIVTAACGGVPLIETGQGSHYTPVGAERSVVKLHTEELGKGDPIVLLHGFGASSYTWRHVREGLARTNRVIAVDLKGFGRSDKPLDEAYSALDQAELVAALIEQRRLDRVTLVGHSFGGSVALATALLLERKHPGRLQRMVLLDAAAYVQGLPPALHILRIPVLGPFSAAVVPPEVQSGAALMLAYRHPSKITSADITAYAKPIYEEGNRHALVQTANKIIPEHAHILAHRYRTLPQPALLVWCREDKIVPLAIGERLAKELPRARLEVLDGCGHLPHEEEPEKTLALITKFFADNPIEAPAALPAKAAGEPRRRS